MRRRFPFRWTINPYRGCQHSCVYCFARNTHTYLGFDAGNDFNSRIVVKQRAADVLRRELRRPGWKRELIMLGTPHPRRLEALATLVRAGVPAGVMLAPIRPGLNDSRESIEAVVRAAAEHGARTVTPVVLNLRPGTKDWFMSWLPNAFPHLVEGYVRLYPGSRAYAPPAYEAAVQGRVHDALARWGFDGPPVDAEPPRGQLALAFPS